MIILHSKTQQKPRKTPQLSKVPRNRHVGVGIIPHNWYQEYVCMKGKWKQDKSKVLFFFFTSSESLLSLPLELSLSLSSESSLWLYPQIKSRKLPTRRAVAPCHQLYINKNMAYQSPCSKGKTARGKKERKGTDISQTSPSKHYQTCAVVDPVTRRLRP